ncbi:ABC transporter permease subunit [Halocatena halophila]|uniref:ABC transporter permease subunit n=1 Tax=Halocatena halophila TaxID=2814576 RepID=UPI002ED1428B
MTVEDVLRRDLTSVYRSRTGAAVAAITALSTVVIIGLIGIAPSSVVGLVGGLLIVGILLALVFLGDPKLIAITAVLFTGFAIGLVLVLSWPLLFQPLAFRPSMDTAVVGVGSLLSLTIPVVALLSSYATIIGERNSGSIRFLVGLPNSRSDAFVGKFISRSLVVVIPLVLGLLLAGIIVELTYQSGSFLSMLGLAAVSIPYALVFVGLGLTASTYGNSIYQVVAIVVAALATLRIGWTAIRFLLVWDTNPPHPEWFYWIASLNPFNAYITLTSQFTTTNAHHPLLGYPSDRIFVDGTVQIISNTETIAKTPAVAAVVLLGWMVITPLFGYFQFKKADLL